MIGSWFSLVADIVVVESAPDEQFLSLSLAATKANIEPICCRSG
jgi:hypothetical protein